jgi:hypothetical protein
MASNVQLDPFVAQAQNDDVALLQKIEGTYPTTQEIRSVLQYANLIHNIARSEQDHSGGSDRYANDARVGRPSPFASNDPSLS